MSWCTRSVWLVLWRGFAMGSHVSNQLMKSQWTSVVDAEAGWDRMDDRHTQERREQKHKIVF